MRRLSSACLPLLLSLPALAQAIPTKNIVVYQRTQGSRTGDYSWTMLRNGQRVPQGTNGAFTLPHGQSFVMTGIRSIYYGTAGRVGASSISVGPSTGVPGKVQQFFFSPAGMPSTGVDLPGKVTAAMHFESAGEGMVFAPGTQMDVELFTDLGDAFPSYFSYVELYGYFQ